MVACRQPDAAQIFVTPTDPFGQLSRKDRCEMSINTWPPPAQTDLTVQVTTGGLAGVYDATVRLGRAELFRAGWQPMLDPVTLRQLLADLAGLGDEPTQLAALGWTLRATGAGQVALIETNLPPEPLDQVDDRFVLPPECGFTVVGDLPPLAQLYRSLSLLEAYAYGPTDQLVEPDELLAQASTAAHALGDIFGALLGLAVDTDADTVHAALTRQTNRTGATDGEPAPPAPPADADAGTPATDAITYIHALHERVLTAAAQMVTAYLPTASLRSDPTRHVSAAEQAFTSLTADQRTRLLRGVFENLEYDPDGRPGSEWSSDTTQALGDLFAQFGITFTSPDQADNPPEPAAQTRPDQPPTGR
jgi:hypothetical protein